MARTYNEDYLEDAMDNLGTAFEYAYQAYGMAADTFYTAFLNSGLGAQFERGSVKYVAGMSGKELASKAVNEFRSKQTRVEDNTDFGYSLQYWCGYILAYFQWKHAIGFKQLRYYLEMKDLEKLYGTLHETSLERSDAAICKYIMNKRLKSKLQYYRLMNDLSQSELSKISGVSLRMIQQYEQRKKDINKASTDSLYRLSFPLHCRIEDLMEWDFTKES